jgi:hypothetical protein
VRVHPAVVEPVDDLERGVVERVGERGAQLLRLGVPGQLGGQALHRARHEQPPAHEAREEGEGQDRECERDRPGGDRDRVPAQVEPPRENRAAQRADVEDRGEQHWLERPAHDRRRTAEPGAEPHRDRHGQRDQHHLPEREDEVLEDGRLVSDDVEGVRRAPVRAGRVRRGHRIRVDEQRGRQVQEEDVRGRHGDEHAVGRAGQPSRRERQDHVDGRQLGQPAAEAADAVDDRVRRVGQRGHEPEDADPDEQAAEARERHTPARVEPDRDRRPDQQRTGQPLEPVVARRRPRRDEHAGQAAQRGPGDGGGASRA